MTSIAQIKGPAWAQKTPDDWKVTPIRAVLKERKEKNTKLKETNILSVMKDVGVIRYEDKGNVGNKSSDRPEAYKIVRPMDLVLNSMNLSIGSVGMSRESGVTSSVYIIYQAIPGIAHPDFFNYLFQTRVFQRHLATYGRGIMELREAVKERDIRNQLIALPPLETQKRIADFLDAKTKTVDELIANKEQLIELLKEKRAAIITQAVTKGLDPKTKLKPSGVEWVKEIPESWTELPLKFLFDYSQGGVWGDEPANDENDIICVRVADFDVLTLTAHSEDFTYRNLPEIRSKFLLNERSLLLEKSGGGEQQPVGRLVQYLGSEKAVCSNFVQKMQLKNGYNTRFITLLFCALYFTGETKKAIKQTTGIQNLDMGYFLRTSVFLPTSKEQDLIVEYVDKESILIIETISKIQSQIRKLKEYRSSLIYSAVTGKINVT